MKHVCDGGRVGELSLKFLGTGTSVGVPVIGCGCAVCRSDNPKNNRTRASVVVTAGDWSLLVDTGPDLRTQALREGLTRVDAVLYTHAHMDHVVGFDDLRAFCWRRTQPLPIHASPATLADLKRMFAWAFAPENQYPGYVKPAGVVIDGPFHYGDLRITPLPVNHGAVDTMGFLFEYPRSKSMAYIPDVKVIPPATIGLMKGVDVLIVDALRTDPHPTHFSVGEALRVAEETEASEVWLTHLGHENDHDRLSAVIPEHVKVAWDGLELR
ncbi:MAG: MBL fold metallo-hydrolase [Verrucomicrobiaceae bacterium]|nr:MAG: MBL fold metallo-hydrolase [Verrucomicrobiaceae bacterium]